MNTYKSTRHAKFLLNYHFVWIPKYQKRILNSDKIKQLIVDPIDELATQHDFDVLALEIMPDHIHLFVSVLLSIHQAN